MQRPTYGKGIPKRGGLKWHGLGPASKLCTRSRGIALGVADTTERGTHSRRCSLAGFVSRG